MSAIRVEFVARKQHGVDLIHSCIRFQCMLNSMYDRLTNATIEYELLKFDSCIKIVYIGVFKTTHSHTRTQTINAVRSVGVCACAVCMYANQVRNTHNATASIR